MEVPSPQLDALARLGLDGVDALVVVAVVGRVVGRQKDPLGAGHRGATLSCGGGGPERALALA